MSAAHGSDTGPGGDPRTPGLTTPDGGGEREPASEHEPASEPASESAFASEPATPTRERLVGAAWDLMGEGGPDAVTLREVGRRTGVSRTAPYRHFRDKDDLLRAVAVRAFEQLRDRMLDAVGAAADAPAALRAACRAYIGFALEHPRQYSMMFGEWVLGQKHAEGPQAVPLRAAAERLFGLAAEVVASGQRQGVFRAGDPADMSLLTWSALHGLVTFTMSARPSAAPLGGAADETIDRLVGEVVEGLRSGGGT